MQFELVITTYNRPESVLRLVKEAQSCNPAPRQVIVIDSSDAPNETLQTMVGVLYVRSSHKNQPYQRLLGAYTSGSDILVYFDDDLEIVESSIFATILAPFRQEDIVGSSVAFAYHGKHNENLINNTQYGPLLGWLWSFTGVPNPTTGKAHRLGVVGQKPDIAGSIQTFNGANMAFKRAIVPYIIPDDLLSMAELRLQSGEDKVISMLASVHGRLWYNPDIYLRHPPNESTYFQNIRSFTAKVTYSRLYLSRIYAQVFYKSWRQEVLLYYWFTSWRVLIALIFMLIGPNQGRKDKFFGTLDGLWLALNLPQKAEKLTPEINWEVEIQKDLINATNATGRI